MFVVTCPMREDRLALTLERDARRNMVKVESPLIDDALATLTARYYGEPVQTPRGLVFAEDN
jgi:hypothetical protein